MANGVAGVGFQQVLSVPAQGTTLFRVIISAPRGAFPQRVGYLFLRKAHVSDALQDYVVFRTPVYSPGIILRVLNTGSDLLFNYVVVVDWNLAGVRWDVTAA